MTNTKMLINATRSQMLRVAIVEGTILQEYQVEIAEGGLSRGNIYRGVVANIQQSLNAAFIDIGEERHAFLPVADVLPSAYHKHPPDDARRPRIDQVLEKGKSILVQVTKDGVGQKGAALTTNIALAGRYLVLTPFDEVRGISRKAEDDDERKTVRERLKKLALPDGVGVIVRTNGLEQNQTTLNKDLSALLRLWRSVYTEAQQGSGPKLIYSDQDLVVQMLRDYLDPEIGQVVVDSDEVFDKVDEYMKAFMPRSKTKLVRYRERLPLFSRYRIETQIDRIYERMAPLPGGGSIVIDTTEALTAVDVNSGRATRTNDHDESIFNINCEAAHEVARQLRLRDIGGLVVVDFIDMRLRKHQNKLEKVMREAMRFDKARYSVGRISPNGLLEINRQRIKQALRLRTHRPCPTCQGAGSIPTPDFAALRILTRIEARASTGLMKSVTFALHPEIADSLQNGHRRELAAIEAEYRVDIQVIAAPSLARTEERVDWVEREPGSEPVATREPAIRASDLSRPAPPEPEEAPATRRPAAKAEARKPLAKDSAAAGEENGNGGANGNGDGEKTRRKRRRRRRRRGNGEEIAADAPLAAADLRGENDDFEGDDDGPELDGPEGAELAQSELGLHPEGQHTTANGGESGPTEGETSAVPEGEEAAKAPVRREKKRERRSPRSRRAKAELEDDAPATGDEPAGTEAESEDAPALAQDDADFAPRQDLGVTDDEDPDGDDEENGDDGNGENGDEGANGDEGERNGRRRRRRRRGGRGRRRRKEGEGEAPAQEAEASDFESPPRVAEAPDHDVAPPPAKAAGRPGRGRNQPKAPSGPKGPGRQEARPPKAPPAPRPAGEGDSDFDDDDFPQPLTNAGNDPAIGLLGNGLPGRTNKRNKRAKKRGDRPRNPADYDERQPASNESALHYAGGNVPAAAPAAPPANRGQVDRNASARLRWQWWGGDGPPAGGRDDRDE